MPSVNNNFKTCPLDNKEFSCVFDGRGMVCYHKSSKSVCFSQFNFCLTPKNSKFLSAKFIRMLASNGKFLILFRRCLFQLPLGKVIINLKFPVFKEEGEPKSNDGKSRGVDFKPPQNSAHSPNLSNRRFIKGNNGKECKFAKNAKLSSSVDKMVAKQIVKQLFTDKNFAKEKLLLVKTLSNCLKESSLTKTTEDFITSIMRDGFGLNLKKIIENAFEKIVLNAPKEAFKLIKSSPFIDFWAGSGNLSSQMLRLILEELICYLPLSEYDAGKGKKRLFFAEVKPADKRWDDFLQLNAEYLRETEERFKTLTIAEIIPFCKKMLLKQSKDKKFFMLYQGTEQIGLMNFYIKDKNVCITEFYLSKSFRNGGLASKFINIVKNWAVETRKKKILVEVSKDNFVANKFWQSIEFNLEEKETVNLYFFNIG